MSILLDWLIENMKPEELTRENYLGLAYFGDEPPAEEDMDQDVLDDLAALDAIAPDFKWPGRV